MRRYDLLDEYATVIAPHLGPQARSRPRPVGNLKPSMRKVSVPKLWPAPVAPVALLAIGIVLLVAS